MPMNDKEIIEYYGGATKLAHKLGFSSHHDVIKVNQWKTRGIPARVKLTFPEVFLRRIFKK
jgi:hypothetical protein